MATGELVGLPVDVAVGLVAGQQTERTGALLEDLLEVRAAAATRSRLAPTGAAALAGRVAAAVVLLASPPECRTPYGASIDWMRDASSLILKGLASVCTLPYASSFGAVEAFTSALTTSTLGSLP